MLRRDTVRNAADATDPSAPTYIFLHIPKTAGTTLRLIIERNYSRADRYSIPLPPAAYRLGPGAEGHPRDPGRPARSPDTEIQNLARLPEERKRRLRMVYGHTVFGVHEVLPGPCAYVTMLREPVGRVVSTYHYVRSRQDLWMHDAVMQLTLDEYVQGPLIQESGNLQTRIIAGDFSWSASCTEETLERAKRNIEEHFISVGLTERFDETVLLWGKVMGWRRIHYASRNVARGNRDAPSREAIRAIQDANVFDAELYRFVAARLDQQLENYPSLGRELPRFRRANSLFGRVYTPAVRVRRRLKRAVLR